MKKTYRMQRGIISFSLMAFFLFLWLLFYQYYPLLVKMITFIKLPNVEPNIFLVLSSLIAVSLFVGWSYRNKLWYGIPFALSHYSTIKRLRRQIKDARFEDEHEFNHHLVLLPKIKITFDDNQNRKSGKIFIQNSIEFDSKLEKMRIDSALSNFVSERQYLSKDRNWYVYEFYAVESNNQVEIKSVKELIDWSNKTSNDYSIRLDERTTVPLHHMGLVGQTGSGKSFFIQTLVEQILSKKVNHDLFVIDPKRTDVYQMAKRYLGSKQTADKTNALELIKRFYEQMRNRQNELEDYFVSNSNTTYKEAGLPALILLIDEFGALRESWKTLTKHERDEIDSILSDIAFMGRQLGCILWVATQQMNAQTVPTAIREQLVLKIALGESDEQTYRTLFSSGVNIPPVQFAPGQGVYSFPNMASIDKPRLLIVPFCSFLNRNP
ncbi:DUF87 domain-containing protein [Exiguobacterium sp. SH5S13]|uniref:FtsK/SpoIIIE domain-containing protein n=1 Tax=Exiguobacterium sp. SH5S13 TaxID=2510959 RepID=UPI00103D3221|nr:FtsK/SpoIIIE domain-containing protein [Exiguobacterium sp. SH5S13]TCI52066.1 DUF87 domain-containing protein [Exiguobacterium sp. SH5S13]